MAMRRGDKREARRLLNQILTGIYSFGFEDLQKTKGYIVDLMTLMSRTIVECGADPELMVGDAFVTLSELSAIHDEEGLSRWVGETFEKLITAMETVPSGTRDMRIQLIRNYVREHCGEPISRDGVARRIGLSNAHFSRMLKEATGQTFTDYLRQVRIEKAVRLLRQSDWTVLAVGLECGFEDASYFTKVFKRVMGMAPLAFRRKARNF
jgi:AraC-like DNA-binding protein